MKSVEFNFQLKQCGLYKAPPFQVRWGNRKLFYNGYIVCTQKTIWIHVSCQASFGIFNKRGKLSSLQRKPPKQISTVPFVPLKMSADHTTLTSLLNETPGCWKTRAQHFWLHWEDDYGLVPSVVKSVLHKCAEISLNVQHYSRHHGDA